MKERRYRDSFRVVTGVDPATGRARRTAEYTGEWYAFPAGSPAPRRRGLRLCAGAGLYWLLALAHLRLGHAASHCAYALLPFLAGLIPGVYALMGAAALARAPARMTVPQRENGPGRASRAAFGCALLSAAGAVGCAVYLTLAGRWPEGWPEPLLAAAAAAAAGWTFARARRDWRELTASN